MEGKDNKKMHGRAQNLRSRMKRGHLPGMDEGTWDITSRTLDDGTSAVWVMFKKKE